MATRLSDAIFWIALAASAIAQLFIVRAVFRVTPNAALRGPGTRRTTPEENAADVMGEQQAFTGTAGVPAPHRLTEIVWVILPVLLLALAFFGAWRTMHPDTVLRAGLTGAAAMGRS